MKLMILASALVVAASTVAQQQSDFVVKVGKGGLTQKELDLYEKRGARELGKMARTLTDEDREKIRQKAIDEEVLFQAAIDAGALREKTTRSRIIQEYKSTQTTAKISPRKFSEAEIKAFYNSHKKDFVQPVQIKFDVLVFAKGAPRAEVQKKLSTAMRTPDKVRGWKNTGWTEPGERFRTPLSAKQTKPLFNLRKGKVSRLIRDSFGTQYLFWARDRKAPKQLSLRECRAKVVNHMIQAKQSGLGDELAQKLRAKGGRGKSLDDLQFDAALEANTHRSWHTRQRVINTFVHDKKKTREQLLPSLRRRYRVAMPPR